MNLKTNKEFRSSNLCKRVASIALLRGECCLAVEAIRMQFHEPEALREYEGVYRLEFEDDDHQVLDEIMERKVIKWRRKKKG